ncbi:competence protein [Campylobacterota bacterium]|nr:competence protein [Campylobacterota bacterium]
MNIALSYRSYCDLVERKFYDAEAVVISQNLKINKHNKPYWVLRLKSDKLGSFYTTTNEDIKPITGRDLRLVLITDKIEFIDFLRGFYAPSFHIALKPTVDQSGEYAAPLYDIFVSFLADQHSNPMMQELFPALFLAAPQSKELRNSVVKYAAAHLIALSGFHLSILTVVLGVLLGLPYRFFQQRFFPYRNGYIDLGIITLIILGWYLVFTGIVPSLLRAYAMLVFGMFLVFRHIALISFQTLAIVSIVLISFDPSLLFSIGFILSVSGVYFIFLYLHHFKNRPKIETAIGLSVYVFTAMLPIVHYYFAPSAYSQLISPILTLIYAPFFIIELALHLAIFGDLLDPFLIAAIEWQTKEWNFTVPIWIALPYVALSIAAIFHRYIHYLFMLVLIGWLLVQYLFYPWLY